MPGQRRRRWCLSLVVGPGNGNGCPMPDRRAMMATPERPGPRQAAMLELQPITFAEARAFVKRYHRHHRPPVGHKFSIAANDGEKVVGVAIVGRPVARNADDGYTAEVTRLCTDGAKNACSMLYAACWRAARAMGYRRLITYLLNSESGGSVAAAGWREVHKTSGGSWSRSARPRVDKHPTEAKTLWEVRANE